MHNYCGTHFVGQLNDTRWDIGYNVDMLLIELVIERNLIKDIPKIQTIIITKAVATSLGQMKMGK